ncbi:MAG: hypothetical protein GXP26_02600 [Planctomycetes bacterium]|nr:hypothetical protein [Planctomycetota bacterium]
MKLRQYLQAAAYCMAALSTSFVSAADVDYTSAEQRIRDLELRVDTLELANSKVGLAGNQVNLAGFNGCDSSSSGCDSCGSSVGCGSGASCCGSSNWLRPCPTSQFDAEWLLFAVSDSEADPGDTQNNFNAGLRLTYNRVNEQGRIFRVRYFNFSTALDGGTNRLDMETIDTEIGRRFTLGGGLKGEFTGGVRFAAFTETGQHDYDATFGPLVGMQLRGRKFLRGTSFVSLRHSWQFGDSSANNPAADLPGTFNISEVQFGLEWQRQSRLGTLVLRTALETQYWAGVGEADTEDYGLYGTSTSFGLAF